MARNLKFRIEEVEGLYYLFSENKGVDQLLSYHAVDLSPHFSHMHTGFFMTRPKFQKILILIKDAD